MISQCERILHLPMYSARAAQGLGSVRQGPFERPPALAAPGRQHSQHGAGPVLRCKPSTCGARAVRGTASPAGGLVQARFRGTSRPAPPSTCSGPRRVVQCSFPKIFGSRSKEKLLHHASDCITEQGLRKLLHHIWFMQQEQCRLSCR
jgi:hypothetical protein